MPLNLTNLTMVTCNSTLSQELFGYLLDEECIAGLYQDAAPGCPMTEADDFLRRVFSDFQIFSLLLAPYSLCLFFLLVHGGGIPERETRWGKVVYAVWLGTQCGTLIFYCTSLAVYVMAYVSFHWRFHDCYRRVGSAPILHLVMITGAPLHVAFLNRYFPAFLVTYSIAMSLELKYQRSPVCLGALFLVLGLVFVLFACSLLFNFATLSMFFAVIFIPISLMAWVGCALPLVALGMFIRVLRERDSKALEMMERITGLPLQEMPSLSSLRIQSVADGIFVAPSVLLMFAALFWGQALAFMVYAGNDGKRAIGAIYSYTMNPVNFQVPELVDFELFFQDLHIFGFFSSVLETQPTETLSVSTVLAAFSTTISLVRTIVVTGSSFLYKRTGGAHGAKTQTMKEIREVAQKRLWRRPSTECTKSAAGTPLPPIPMGAATSKE